MTEVMQGYAETIRYMLEIIRTVGPFVGIVGFSEGKGKRREDPSSPRRRGAESDIEMSDVVTKRRK
jgi:hypothetical protein